MHGSDVASGAGRRRGAEGTVTASLPALPGCRQRPVIRPGRYAVNVKRPPARPIARAVPEDADEPDI